MSSQFAVLWMIPNVALYARMCFLFRKWVWPFVKNKVHGRGYYFGHRPSSQSSFFPKGQSEHVLPFIFDSEEGDRSTCRNTVGRLAWDYGWCPKDQPRVLQCIQSELLEDIHGWRFCNMTAELTVRQYSGKRTHALWQHLQQKRLECVCTRPHCKHRDATTERASLYCLIFLKTREEIGTRREQQMRVTQVTTDARTNTATDKAHGMVLSKINPKKTSSGGQRSRGVTLTTHPHLAPRLR